MAKRLTDEERALRLELAEKNRKRIALNKYRRAVSPLFKENFRLQSGRPSSWESTVPKDQVLQRYLDKGMPPEEVWYYDQEFKSWLKQIRLICENGVPMLDGGYVYFKFRLCFLHPSTSRLAFENGVEPFDYLMENFSYYRSQNGMIDYELRLTDAERAAIRRKNEEFSEKFERETDELMNKLGLSCDGKTPISVEQLARITIKDGSLELSEYGEQQKRLDQFSDYYKVIRSRVANGDIPQNNNERFVWDQLMVAHDAPKIEELPEDILKALLGRPNRTIIEYSRNTKSKAKLDLINKRLEK